MSKILKITRVTTINNIPIIESNTMADCINCSDEERRTKYYSFDESNNWFHTEEEAILSLFAHNNGIDDNDLWTAVRCAKKVLSK